MTTDEPRIYNERAERLDAYRARIAELEQQLYTAEQKYTGACSKLAEATRQDLPELDGTDAAHPAWWRGYDYGVASICRALAEVLDGKEPTGTCAEPLESLRRRVWEAREDGKRLEWLESHNIIPMPITSRSVELAGGYMVRGEAFQSLRAAIRAEAFKEAAEWFTLRKDVHMILTTLAEAEEAKK